MFFKIKLTFDISIGNELYFIINLVLCGVFRSRDGEKQERTTAVERYRVQKTL